MSPLHVANSLRLGGLVLTIAVLIVAPIDTAIGLFDLLYPEGGVPRTHPLTWTCLLLAVIATFHQRPFRAPTVLEHALWITAILIALFKPWIAPVVDGLVPELQLGSMGWNTSITIVLIAAGQLLRTRWLLLAMVCAIGGVFFPGVALNGLLLGNDDFYGQMAAPTALAMFGLALANMVRYARRPGFRLILSDTAAGRLVRRQVVCWIALACAMPVALRLTDIANGSSFALLYTAQMACILIGILHFGLRFARLFDNARRLERDLLREAQTDPLTGAATRRAAVSHFIQQAWRTPMGVLLLDIDHFKQVNDQHGHAAGDRVLQVAVQSLREELRITDLIARWGGEELLVLIPASDPSVLRARAEALRTRLQLTTAADPSIPGITVSVGVAIAEPGLEPDLSSALEQADQAMYRAKAGGRNQVVVYNDRRENLQIVKAA